MVIKAYVIAAISAGGWNFSDQTASQGLQYTHVRSVAAVPADEVSIIYSGLALGDLNNDGWDDIFAVTGAGSAQSNPNKLYISNQDGTYTESATSWGLSNSDYRNSGPIIMDFNGDGWRDLLIGSAGAGGLSRYYENNGDNTFTDRSGFTGLTNADTFSISASDIDNDGDLDIALTRWIFYTDQLIWLNDGNANFTDVTKSILSDAPPHRSTFTAGLVDMNNDYNVDLLMTSDFSDSKFYLGNGSTFQLTNAPVINDENGMGGAYADYDNDGHLDWFVSSIYDQDGISEANWGVSGNRLYRNNGNGGFVDATDSAGVRDGLWGWGSCFADFNNDMYLDLYHVNGFPVDGVLGIDETDFDNDPAKMFINDGDGTFTEMAAALGVADTGQGRAILCFDNDQDGDLDILINNNDQQSVFFNNNLSNSNHWLQIKLQQPGTNMDAIGAKVYVFAGGVMQMREVIAGGNFGSTVWTTQHFGLGSNTTAAVSVHWDAERRENWLIDTVDQKIVLQPKPDLIFADGLDSAP